MTDQRGTSPEACIEALQEAGEKLGEPPSMTQYESLGLSPSRGTIVNNFGGWTAALKAAGFEPTYQRYTAQECYDAIREVASRLDSGVLYNGRYDALRDDTHPTSSTIRNKTGQTFAEAREEALTGDE